MTDLIAPILFVVTLWWFSTGAVLWLASGEADRVPVRLLLVTALSAFGFFGAAVSSTTDATWSAYCGFASAIAIWAWAEFTFLTGLVTGPRVLPCPDNARGWVRFYLAFKTISRHEIVLVAALGAVTLVTWAGTNRIALWTFLILWVMRISAKLTMFSGAPALSLDIMPHRLSHMKSYFRQDRIGPAFWISTLASTIIVMAVVVAFFSDAIDPNQRITVAMLATLVAVAAFEHWMMILPISDTALWRWAMKTKASQERKSEGKKPIDAAKIASAAE